MILSIRSKINDFLNQLAELILKLKWSIVGFVLTVLILACFLGCQMVRIDSTIGAVVTGGPPTEVGVNRNSDRQLWGSEPSLFEWRGSMLYAKHSSENSITIVDYFFESKIATIKTNLDFESMFVVGGICWLFGHSPVDNSIYSSNSMDLQHWTDPVLCVKAPTGHYDLNPSVIFDGQNYIMVIEEWVSGGNNQNSGYLQFAKSPDLISWSVLSTSFDNNRYHGGPTLWWGGTYYYILAIDNLTKENSPTPDSPFWTTVWRSKDLLSWEKNNKNFVPISPFGTNDEGANSTDLDIRPFNGNVLMVYYIGDQKNWGGTRKATFNGDISLFFSKFF